MPGETRTPDPLLRRQMGLLFNSCKMNDLEVRHRMMCSELCTGTTLSGPSSPECSYQLPVISPASRLGASWTSGKPGLASFQRSSNLLYFFAGPLSASSFFCVAGLFWVSANSTAFSAALIASGLFPIFA